MSIFTAAPNATTGNTGQGLLNITAQYVCFTIHGRPVSTNRVTRRFGNRSVKSPEARSYQQTVFQHAFAAAQGQQWKRPEACSVAISAFNSTIDIDNLAKCILDGMNGAIYDDDKSVIELSIYKYKDHDGQRIYVRVTEKPALVKPKKIRVKK